jgi:hypothetical protein
MYVYTSIKSSDDKYALVAIFNKGKYSDVTLAVDTDNHDKMEVWDSEWWLINRVYRFLKGDTNGFDQKNIDELRADLPGNRCVELMKMFETGRNMGFFGDALPPDNKADK